MDRLDDRVVPIAGGALGLGRAAATPLARKGAKLAARGVCEGDVASAIAEIGAAGGAGARHHSRRIDPKRGSPMATINSDLSNLHRGVRDALNARWGLLMFQGVALIILGVLAIAAPLISTLAVEVFIGWLFLIAGIVGLVAMFYADDVAAFLWTLITAALSVGLGVLLLYRPIAGTVTLTLALTAFFVAEGVFQVVTSIAYRKVLPDSWGWLLASGVCDLVLVAIIVSSWPQSAAWVLGLLAGVNLLTSGVALVMTAFAARNAVKSVTNVFK
jgi:uncharacterized membrane protein HdeD (DUF308 family)